ncbi:MAG: mechanosensitive ion channel family protein [Candidatus Geothermarchaeales archaeon]
MTTESVLLVVTGIVIIVVVVIIDQLVRRAITRYFKRMELRESEHVQSILKMLARIIIFASGLTALLGLLGLPTEWFISVSALSGAAIGFASTQTLGNFIAGLYVMITRPFMVKDYVKIGDVEGQVSEISINYTKVYTPTYNIVEIANRRVLDSKILNYSKGDVIDYTFEVSFPAVLPDNITNKELLENCIVPTLEECYERHKDKLQRKMALSMVRLNRLERAFAIRMFFPEKYIDDFYNIQPKLLEAITDRWDSYKKKISRGA